MAIRNPLAVRDQAVRRVRTPGLLLGLGLGGFVDGILLHQIFQWHHMISGWRSIATLAGLEANTVADGVFHLGALLLTVVGLIVLAGVVRRGPWSGWALLGWAVAGWGIFNLVEGLVDHQLLGVHHTRPGPQQTAYDVGLLLLGAALLLVGAAVARKAERTAADSTGSRSAGKVTRRSGARERRRRATPGGSRCAGSPASMPRRSRTPSGRFARAENRTAVAPRRCG